MISLQPVAGDDSHVPGGRLPLLSTTPAVSFPAIGHHCRVAGKEIKPHDDGHEGLRSELV